MAYTQKQMEEKWKRLDYIEKAQYDGFRGFVIKSNLRNIQD